MAKKKFKKKIKPFPKAKPEKQKAVKSLLPQSNPYNLYVAGALLATFIVYFHSIFNDFVLNWDDGGYIVLNPVVQALNWENIRIIFTTFDKGNYHPLTTLFYAVEYFFVGDRPMLYHINNLIIHLVNVYLVFVLVWRLRQNILTAFIVSLFFGIHPMHVESVAWISERKDVMYTMFFLLSMLSFLSYQQKGGKRLRSYMLALLLFFLALMSKSAAVVLPVVLLLVDFYIKRRLSYKLIVEKLPFFAFSLLFGILAFLSQDEAGAIQDLTPLFTMTERVMLASYALISYIGKMFVPISLSAMYPYPDRIAGALPAAFYIAPFIAMLLFGVVIWSLKKGRAVFFGFMFFLVTIALVLQLIPVGGALMAERYTYVPYIGLFFIIGVFVETLKKYSKDLYKIALAVIFIGALIFSYLSYQRVKVWEDGETLFTDVIRKNPNLPFAYNNRGFYYYRFLEDYDKALADFNKCIAIDKNYYRAYSNRGVLLYNINRFEEALSDFDRALALRPDNTDALRGRANTYSSLKMYEKAIPDYDAYLALKPGEAQIILWRGTALYQTGRHEKALQDFNKTIALEPDNDEAYYWRGLVYYHSGAMQRALKELNIAISLNDEKDEVYSWRGLVYYNKGMLPEAIADFDKALELNPHDAAALVNRSLAYDSLGKYKQAFEDLKAAGDMGFPISKDYFMRLYKLVKSQN